MIDKRHPEDLVNHYMVEDMFLELQDTNKFIVDVQDEMGAPRSREFVRFCELEMDKNTPLSDGPFQYYTTKMVERTYIVTQLQKIAIIRANEDYFSQEYIRTMIHHGQLFDIDLKEAISRVQSYLGKEFKHIVDQPWPNPALIIHFNSYKSEKY